jgi:hypothetical protein
MPQMEPCMTKSNNKKYSQANIFQIMDDSHNINNNEMLFTLIPSLINFFKKYRILMIYNWHTGQQF